MDLGERADRVKFLIRDRDGKFSRVFDEVFSGKGIRTIKPPARALRANRYAEWFVGTLRRECLDHLLVYGPRHLRKVLADYEHHYNDHRPHQSRDQKPLAAPSGQDRRREPLPLPGFRVHALVVDAQRPHRDRAGGGEDLPFVVVAVAHHLSVSKSTKLGMEELMDKWEDFAAKDKTVQGIVVDGDLRVSGTDRRITWRTKAKDGSSVIVTSEPKNNGTASIVATQIGLQTLELNDEAREKWASIVKRFLDSV